MKKLIIAALLVLLTPQQVVAQENTDNFGVAYQVDIQTEGDQEIENGMIISHKNGVYQLSTESYDRSIIGVVNFSPKIEFVTDLESSKTSVLSSGTTEVLVSGENGAITEGDLIATSSNPGIGMKALKSGFTLGIATENFDSSNQEERGLIRVRLNKNFTFSSDTPDSETISDRLRDVVSLSAIAALDEPKEVLKYVVAGLILISSIVVAFASFLKTSQKGIEALGRNPMARTSITTGIFVNIVIGIIIIAAGTYGAYFIVTL